MPRNTACTACPLHKTTTNVCVWGNGSTTALIMLVGEAPGQEEEKRGVPFVGSAGQVLERCLHQAGLKREELYITNIAKCRPPANRTPTPDEATTCFRYLAEEIATVRPKVIVALGGAALQLLTERKGITKERGRVLVPTPRIRLGDSKLIATFHPAAALHAGGGSKRVTDAIVQDLRMAARLAGFQHATEKTVEHKRCLITPDRSEDDFLRALHTLDVAQDVACDLEWTAREGAMAWPWTKGAELYTVSLSARVNGVIFSLASSWPPPGGLSALRAFLRRKRIVFHNAMADLLWLYAHNMHCLPYGDTMLLAYLFDEEQRLSLEQLASLYVGLSPTWKIEKHTKRPTTPEKWHELLYYNADDTYATLLLHEKLEEDLRSRTGEERENIEKAYRHLLLPAVPAFVDMSLEGVYIPHAELEAAIAEALQTRDTAARLLSTLANMTPENALKMATSPTQTIAYLSRAYGVLLETSRQDVLEGLDYPEIEPTTIIRHETKFLGTYLIPWREMMEEQGDQRVHSVYRIASTRTGRTSAESEKGGSMQLIPREKRMRRLIAAPPGWKLIAADFSQIELRLVAWLAPERTMARFFREGIDLHRATAAYILAYGQEKLSVEAFWERRGEFMALVTDEERQKAKGANFGFVFGLQAENFVSYARSQYGVTLTRAEAEDIRDGYFRLYNDLETWHRRCEDVDFKRGYVVTPFGRYRRGLADVRKAINTPIQASGSDLTLLTMTEIWRKFRLRKLPAKNVGFVHDAILAVARDDVAEEAAGVIKETMQNPPLARFGIEPPPFPIIADVGIGQNWVEAK